MTSPASSSKLSTRAVTDPYADEPADVRELLEAHDRGETVSLSRDEIRALFKPGNGDQAK